MVIGLAVSQAIYGWVGDGVFFRVVYPALLLAGSTLMLWVGYHAWNFTPESPTESEPPATGTPETSDRLG
jgi:hypothetical protein